MQSNFMQVRNAPGLLLEHSYKKKKKIIAQITVSLKTRGNRLVDNNVIQATLPNLTSNLKPNPKI